MTVIRDRAVAAVIAHGLLNTLAAVDGSARTLRRYGHQLADDDYAALLDTIVDNAAVFSDGLQAILESCSEPFGDAATTMALAACAVRSVPEPELPAILDGIIARSSVLEMGLEAMVRGIPAAQLEQLDQLQRPWRAPRTRAGRPRRPIPGQ